MSWPTSPISTGPSCCCRGSRSPLFWFNPLVWLLAREAHQLREEAADDAVLGADIEDTEYARLLVGVARHECRGMLIGAHGVAPSKNSLSRRVRRVLDGALARAPGGWRWSTAAAFFAAGMAVPVAALNFVPTTPRRPTATTSFAAKDSAGDPVRPYYAAANADAADDSTLSSVIRGAVSTSVAGALSVVHPHPELDEEIEQDIEKAMRRRVAQVATGNRSASRHRSARAARSARASARRSTARSR